MLRVFGYCTPARIPTISEYLSSASPKRRKVKVSHCWFCPVAEEREGLAIHLSSSEQCLLLYVRLLHLKSSKVSAVMVKLHNCINCWISRNVKLNYHLLYNAQCLNKFKEVLGLESVEAITKYVSILRQVYAPSRSKAVRKLKYAEAKKNISSVESLNNYREIILFANFRTCIVCETNCNKYAANKVTDLD